jgi:hypothetical protein
MSLRTFVYEKFTDLSNLITNPSAISQFLQEGTLTPEEVSIIIRTTKFLVIFNICRNTDFL